MLMFLLTRAQLDALFFELRDVSLRTDTNPPAVLEEWETLRQTPGWTAILIPMHQVLEAAEWYLHTTGTQLSLSN